MKKDRYIKSKSIYSIKNVHAKTNAGTIYENDYVTIIDNDDIYNDEMALFSESNFKYKINTTENNKKRHIRSEFIKPNGNKEYWTKNDIKDHVTSDESQIVLKTNYNSLKDFAYYGSAVELIKSTVTDIILRFPGGLYYYDKNLAPEITYNGKLYLLISNECQIDCWSKAENLNDFIKNPLRVLSNSYSEYKDSKGKPLTEPIINLTGSCLNSIVGSVKIGGKEFEIYNDSNNNFNLIVLKSNVKETDYGTMIIEPIEKHFDEFWNNLDDFERVVLNKDSIPLYTAVFETPYQDETGFYYNSKNYTWPTVGNSKTPDLTTSKFNGYLTNLLSLAEFHDEYDSDNIWRMMTHESIKNLDWTFNNEDNELDDIDNSRIKSLIHIQGRIYDDVKRYIDNIKYTNSLSYDQKNNAPDYFLSDIIENDGWENKNSTPFNENTNFTIKKNTTILENSGKTSSYVNTEFLRRLSLSSNYIQSMKGTRNGINAILGMFGYKEGSDYEIHEQVAKCSKFLSYDDTVCLRAEFEYLNSDENTNFMKGYPVAIIVDDNNNYKLIPWFDKDEKYDYDFYFQPKGGWRKVKSININNSLTTYKEITGDILYSETEPYLLFFNTIDDLISIPNNKLFDKMICYVSDISNIDKYYNKGNSETNDYSHYFVLLNKHLSTKLGYVDVVPHKCYGWYNIKEKEFNGKGTITEYGKKVLYLETITANYKSNNPHTGKGNYDFGKEYLEKYSKLFKEALEDGKCDGLSSNIKSQIENVGFGEIISSIDDEKCKIVMFDTQIIDDDNNKDNLSLQNEDDSFKTINIKNLSIRFKTPNGKTNEFKKYVTETVLPYLEQMIPSTTIYELLFDENPTILNTKNEKILSYSVGDVLSNEQSELWIENEEWKK